VSDQKITLTQGALDDRIAYFLQDLYACTRAWEAWQVGTMTEDDFVLAVEDVDIVDDLRTLVSAENALAAENESLKAELEQLKANLEDEIEISRARQTIERNLRNQLDQLFDNLAKSQAELVASEAKVDRSILGEVISPHTIRIQQEDCAVCHKPTTGYLGDMPVCRDCFQKRPDEVAESCERFGGQVPKPEGEAK